VGSGNPRKGGAWSGGFFVNWGIVLYHVCYGGSRGFWQAYIQTTLVLSRFSLPLNNQSI